MSSFNERFYKALQDGLVGYRNRTAANFLQDICGNYCQFTLMVITESEINMAESFNLAVPINDLFTQISDG
eukprot:9532719-Ditylum_brightwellii.AAC.1